MTGGTGQAAYLWGERRWGRPRRWRTDRDPASVGDAPRQGGRPILSYKTEGTTVVRGGAPSVRRWRHTLWSLRSRWTKRGGAHGLPRDENRPRRTQHSLTIKGGCDCRVRGGGTRREGMVARSFPLTRAGRGGVCKFATPSQREGQRTGGWASASSVERWFLAVAYARVHAGI